MFVNHLRDRVAQQDDVLIKRLDLALQLDSIYKINRNRNVLPAQSIEKRVLEKLTFVVAHDMFRVQKWIGLDNITATTMQM